MDIDLVQYREASKLAKEFDTMQARMFACTQIFHGSKLPDGNLRIIDKGYLIFTWRVYNHYIHLSGIRRCRKQRPKSLIFNFIRAGKACSVKYNFPSPLIRDTVYEEVKDLARNFLEDSSPLLSEDEESESDDENKPFKFADPTAVKYGFDPCTC